jgi:TonB family protein
LIDCFALFGTQLCKMGFHPTVMSLFLDTQETSQRFGDHVSEFRSVLETNHIPHGSPEDIFKFATVLKNSNQFRRDLAAMVWAVVKRERDEMMLTDMMSVIATSVGGPSFEETHYDTTEPNNILMEFLLGTGFWRHFGPPSSSVSEGTGSPQVRPVRVDEQRTAQPEEQQRTQTFVPASAIAEGSDEPKDLGGLLDASSELRQMLSQLETNAQQIKQHLASIEQRISSMEPQPEVLPVEAPAAPAPLPDPSSANSVPDKVAKPPAEGVRVFEVALPPRGGRATFSDQPEQSPADNFQSPTFAYAAESRRSAVPVGVFLALLTIVAGGLFFAHSGQGQALLEAGMSRLNDVRTHFNGGPVAVSQEQAPTLPTEAPSLPSPKAPPTGERTVTQVTPTYSETSDEADPGVSPNVPSTPVKPKIRYVPANVMVGYLLSAPRPQYPPLARTNHIEGNVALQATISKTGTVETLHVIKGPQPLLEAAIDAVRDWRYKPYSVDGRPVEVTTTVYVDFSLRPPPVKAY